jgi:hypothetical protein
MDLLTGVLCMSIGSAVAWLIALYTQRGVHLLLWDFPFATAGAALCALAITWIAPAFAIVGLVIAGPLCAALMIFIGDIMKSRLTSAFRRAR